MHTCHGNTILTNQINNSANQISRCVGILNRLKTIKFLPSNIKLKNYTCNAFIRSRIDYGISIIIMML